MWTHTVQTVLLEGQQYMKLITGLQNGEAKHDGNEKRNRQFYN